MPTSWRRIVREKVLQALYAYELSKEPIASISDNLFDNLRKHKSEFRFANELLNAVVRHQEELDAIIRLKTANWQFDRIAIIDMLLLRVGICELLFFPDIPPKVSINEAIEIAKTFSTEKSGQFVNGILDAVFEELRASGKLVKTGRGLINETPPQSATKKK